MKVGVTAQGDTLDSPVDGSFGRAAYFLIINTDDDSFDVIDNSANVNAMGGAGVQAAQDVVDKGIEWILTGSMGPRAYEVISSAGVKIGGGATGTVRDALARLKEGGFDPLDQSGVGPQGIGKGRGMGGGRGGGRGMGR